MHIGLLCLPVETLWLLADTPRYVATDIATNGEGVIRHKALRKSWQHRVPNEVPFFYSRIKMQMTKTLIALTVAAGFAGAAFAQGAAAPAVAPAAPAAKVAAPAPAVVEKKVEAPKVAEPAVEKKAEAAKPEAKVKKVKQSGEQKAQAKTDKVEAKAEVKPEVKPAPAVPAAK